MHRPAYFNSPMWEFPPAAVPLLEWEMKKKLNAFDDWDISEILYLKSIYYPNEISANLQIYKNWAYPSCRFSSPVPATIQSKGASQNKL